MDRERQESLLQRLAEATRSREEADQRQTVPEELVRPLSAEAKVRIVERLESIADQATAPAVDPARERPQWVPFLVAAALVLAVLGLQLRGGGGAPGGEAPGSEGGIESLPRYVLSLEGQLRGTRATEPAAGANTFALGNRLRLDLRPEVAPAMVVAARAYLQARSLDSSPAPKALPARLLRVSASGSVRLEGIVGQDLPLSEGSWRLLVVIAPEGRLPALEVVQEDLDAAPETSPGPWVARVLDFTVRSGG